MSEVLSIIVKMECVQIYFIKRFIGAVIQSHAKPPPNLWQYCVRSSTITVHSILSFMLYSISFAFYVNLLLCFVLAIINDEKLFV